MKIKLCFFITTSPNKIQFNLLPAILITEMLGKQESFIAFKWLIFHFGIKFYQPPVYDMTNVVDLTKIRKERKPCPSK